MWVRRRCQGARQKIENGFRAIDASAPLHDQVTEWMFATSVTTQVLLVAALRNPTVRLRYRATRDVLADYGHSSPERSTPPPRWPVPPFFFSTDITPAARPVAIDGSQELIDSGYHREAVFWIVATFARCHKILAADASPELRHALAPAFEATVADLGITSTDDILSRANDVNRFMPTLL